MIENASLSEKITIIGDRTLSAWPIAPGFVWVQTRDPKLARKLAQRGDSKLRAWGVCGGYLRTFEFHHGLAWARRLIGRYIRNGMATNSDISDPIAPICRPQGFLLTGTGVDRCDAKKGGSR